ncbi:MAG: ssDNA-binding domain-containing protein, partial [Oscillospiraceae bacterium]|nr:ssDNA-binding domain-containing protein [Oscillospiraceae bacterium]
LLIHIQRPGASRVEGFNAWKTKFGRHVKKGEKGITILAPTPFKKKIEEMKLDPDTKAPVLDSNGNAVIEEKEVEIPMFRPVKVFDVSQTEGEPLPSLMSDLTGNVQHYEAFMEALRRSSPVPISFKPIEPDIDGFFRLSDQTITIREGMSQVQTVCTAIHEITHAKLHNREKDRLASAAGSTDREPPKKKDKHTMEVEAEAVAFSVCSFWNIDTSANSLGYIASWSKDKTLPELKASLETISKTANDLISDIEKHYTEICQERGIDLTAQQLEQDTPAVSSDTPEQFAADLYDFMDQLHQEGVLKHPWTSDPREQSIADLVTEMQNGYFEGVRSPLAYIAAHMDTDLIKVKTLTERMNALAAKLEGREQVSTPAAPEQKYVYKMDTNTLKVGADDQHFIQAYEKTGKQTLIPGAVLFVGTADVCRDLLEQLQNGTLQYDDFFTVRAASISNYTAKDGMELDVFVGMDEKIYMGRRDHYDNRGHYINQDKSLTYVSDNGKMFGLLYGEGYTETQAAMVEKGVFTQEDYAEFAALQADVLAQFEQKRAILFAGKPFQPPQAQTAEAEQAVPSEPEQSEQETAAETKLDEYPMPDNDLTVEDLERDYGYLDGDMLPVSKDRAAELLEQDFSVYAVAAGGSAEMLFDRDELAEYASDTMFTVSREEWEASPAFHQAIVDRLDYQEEREQNFLNHAEDCFAIYQVKDGDEQQYLHYIGMDLLHEKGFSVDRANYDLVYTAALPDVPDVNAALDALWEGTGERWPSNFAHGFSGGCTERTAGKEKICCGKAQKSAEAGT